MDGGGYEEDALDSLRGGVGRSHWGTMWVRFVEGLEVIALLLYSRSSRLPNKDCKVPAQDLD